MTKKPSKMDRAASHPQPDPSEEARFWDAHVYTDAELDAFQPGLPADVAAILNLASARVADEAAPNVVLDGQVLRLLKARAKASGQSVSDVANADLRKALGVG